MQLQGLHYMIALVLKLISICMHDKLKINSTSQNTTIKFNKLKSAREVQGGCCSTDSYYKLPSLPMSAILEYTMMLHGIVNFALCYI